MGSHILGLRSSESDRPDLGRQEKHWIERDIKVLIWTGSNYKVSKQGTVLRLKSGWKAIGSTRNVNKSKEIFLRRKVNEAVVGENKTVSWPLPGKPGHFNKSIVRPLFLSSLCSPSSGWDIFCLGQLVIRICFEIYLSFLLCFFHSLFSIFILSSKFFFSSFCCSCFNFLDWPLNLSFPFFFNNKALEAIKSQEE